MTVIISHKAKHNAGHHCFRRKTAKELERTGDNRRVLGKQGGYHISMEKDCVCDKNTYPCAKTHTHKHSVSGSFLFAGSDVLSYKSCHRLHDRRRYQHDKRLYLLRYTISRGCIQTETVYKSTQCQKCQACQKLLYGQRQSDPQKTKHLF